jgi:hypothetical protein
MAQQQQPLTAPPSDTAGAPPSDTAGAPPAEAPAAPPAPAPPVRHVSARHHAARPQPPGATGDVIQNIAVVGNQRIEAGTILSYMLVQPGDSFSGDRVDKSLRTLYATTAIRSSSPSSRTRSSTASRSRAITTSRKKTCARSSR